MGTELPEAPVRGFTFCICLENVIQTLLQQGEEWVPASAAATFRISVPFSEDSAEFFLTQVSLLWDHDISCGFGLMKKCKCSILALLWFMWNNKGLCLISKSM